MLQAFCHKGNEGKPKRHKKAKSDLKPIKTEEFAGVAFSVGEVNWWSGKEELKNISNPTKSENIPCRRFFCHKGNEGKPNGIKRQKAIENLLKLRSLLVLCSLPEK